MFRVALVVTGDLERKALAGSLQRIFPGCEFTVEMKLDSFTSARVRGLGAAGTPRLVDKVAAALVAAVDPGRTGTPADRAIVVEDLELVNVDQPEVVVDEFRRAVLRHVDEHWPSEDRRVRARARLRERASFHLMVPMTEAYFLPSGASSRLRASRHLLCSFRIATWSNLKLRIRRTCRPLRGPARGLAKTGGIIRSTTSSTCWIRRKTNDIAKQSRASRRSMKPAGGRSPAPQTRGTCDFCAPF